jgi:hypothetical protein
MELTNQLFELNLDVFYDEQITLQNIIKQIVISEEEEMIVIFAGTFRYGNQTLPVTVQMAYGLEFISFAIHEDDNMGLVSSRFRNGQTTELGERLYVIKNNDQYYLIKLDRDTYSIWSISDLEVEVKVHSDNVDDDLAEAIESIQNELSDMEIGEITPQQSRHIVRWFQDLAYD